MPELYISNLIQNLIFVFTTMQSTQHIQLTWKSNLKSADLPQWVSLSFTEEPEQDRFVIVTTTIQDYKGGYDFSDANTDIYKYSTAPRTY